MKTHRTIGLAVALWLAAAVFAYAGSAHMGTWKLDESKSEFSPGATKNTMVTYEAGKGEMTKITVEGVDKDGKAIKWTWEGMLDGKPYKVMGSAATDEISYVVKDERTNELTAMKDGKAFMTGTITVDKDGKTRVVKTTRTDAEGKKHKDKAYYTKE